MRSQIKEDIYKLANDFISALVKEEQKFISLQKDVEREIAKIKENEELRKVQHQEALNDLKLIEEKTVQAKINYNNKVTELQTETQKYNGLNSDLARIKKETESNLKETETLKNQAQKQLNKNKEVENSYNGKLRFMKEDENNIEERRKKVSAREREAEIKEKANKKGELRLAEDNIKLMERKNTMTAAEQRLKLKQGGVDA